MRLGGQLRHDADLLFAKAQGLVQIATAYRDCEINADTMYQAVMERVIDLETAAMRAYFGIHHRSPESREA